MIFPVFKSKLGEYLTTSSRTHDHLSEPQSHRHNSGNGSANLIKIIQNLYRIWYTSPSEKEVIREHLHINKKKNITHRESIREYSRRTQRRNRAWQPRLRTRTGWPVTTARRPPRSRTPWGSTRTRNPAPATGKSTAPAERRSRSAATGRRRRTRTSRSGAWISTDPRPLFSSSHSVSGLLFGFNFVESWEQLIWINFCARLCRTMNTKSRVSQGLTVDNKINMEIINCNY